MINSIGFRMPKMLIKILLYYFRLIKNVYKSDNFDNKDDTNDKVDNLNDFSKLPYLVIIEIFNQLPDRKELINCSFVCKTWRNIYKTAFKLDSIYLYDNFVPKNTRLFYTNQKTNQFKFIKISNFDWLKLTDNELDFGHIEKFMIDILNYFNLTIIDRKFDFSQIKKLIILNLKYNDDLIIANLKNFSNNFKELEHLEIHGIIFKLDDKSELSLPKIKILVLKNNKIRPSVYNKYSENYLKSLTFNCPLLEVIYLINPNLYVNSLRLNFLHPQSVKYFQIDDFWKKILIDFECGFENLEFLLIGNNLSIYKLKINRKTLKYLPSLKFVSNQTIDSIEFQDSLPKSSGLKIINTYCRLEDWQKKFSEYKRKHNLYPYQIISEYYDNLIRHIPLQLLKSNYFKIRELKIRSVPNELVLIDFLKNIGHLDSLMISHESNLSQFFYNNLPQHLSIGRFVFSDLVDHKKDYKFLQELNVLRIRIPFIELFESIVENLIKNKFYYWIEFKKFKTSENLETIEYMYLYRPYFILYRNFDKTFNFHKCLVNKSICKRITNIEKSLKYIKEELESKDNLS